MNELWTEAVRSIEPMVKPAHRDLWLRPIECVGIDDGRIRLRAPNRYHKEWFEDNFLPPILRDLELRAQRSFVVDFELADEQTAAPAGEAAGGRAIGAPLPGTALSSNDAPTSRSATSSLRARPSQPVPPPPNLVTRYTFDKFVVGPTNQFAHAAAR